MENNLVKQELNFQKLKDLSKKLNKESVIAFTSAVVNLTLAKNVKLMDGALSVWLSSLEKDINSNLFTFNDFIYALDIVRRREIYNRLDYACIYKEAIRISYESGNNNASREYKLIIPENEYMDRRPENNGRTYQK